MRKKSLNFRGIAAASVASVCLPLVVNAEEPPEKPAATALGRITVTESESVPYTVDDSASATKLDLSLRETPQSVTIFTRERLDDQKMQSLRDVLDRTPGVYSYQYDTERVLFTSRGFTVDNLMYDGVPAITHFSTDSVDESLDTALYDRIEIVRGATGLMTGAGSPSASVNLVRKHANSKDLQMQFDVTAGSWDNRRAEADLSGALNSTGTVRARIVGVYQDRESYQSLYDLKKRVIYGVLDADLTSNTRASLGFDYQENNPRGNTWGSFPLFLANAEAANWPRSVTTATGWSFWNRRTKTVFGELSHAFDNGWSLRSTLSWRGFDEQDALFYVYGFPDPETGGGLEPHAYRGAANIREKALDLHASGPVELFGRQHELVIGFNGSQVRNRAVSYEPGDLADTGDFFAWDGSYPQPEFAQQADSVTALDLRQTGFYTAARLSLAEPLKLVVGARFSKFKTEDFNTAQNDDEYQKTLPYAGVIFDISRQFSAFASFTQIFKPQNKKDINGIFLDPIDGRSFEVGLKGEHFDARLNTALTLFETKQSKVATAVTDPETGAPILLDDGTQASKPIDGTRTRGFELEAAGQIRAGWNASIGWSRYQLEDTNGNDVRTFIPRTLVRAFTTWNVPGASNRLTLGGGVNWQSASRTLVASPDGNATLGQTEVTLVSLMARYQLTHNASVQLNGENLLDKKYFVLDEYDNTYYGAPLSVSAAFRLTF